MTFVLLRTWRPFFGRGDEGPFYCDDCCFVCGSYPYTQDSSPVTMFLWNCTSSHERSNKSPAIVWRCSRWSSVSKRGTNFAHTRFMCRSSVKIASHEPTEILQTSAISRTVSLLLLRTIVLTLAIISSFLDVYGRPERGSLSTEVLPSLNRRNHSNTCVRSIASSPYACCNNWYVSVAVFPILKQNLMQMRCSILSHIVKIADIIARVTSATYYSQLNKRSHLQLVSWVAKTCTNMSRLVANTSHPVSNHYNSNPDTFFNKPRMYIVKKHNYILWYRGPGFDSRRYQIFWVVVGLERGPLSLVRSIEELLE